jgi:low affinity Fe/Cu permease
MADQRPRLVVIGDRLSDGVSRLFAHPGMQIGVILFCAAWFLIGFETDLLTATLSILAITLTQMVLNGQYDREAEAHRRDVAMHAKLDELIKATKRARNEMVGIEEDLDEDAIRELREEAKELVEQAARKSGEVADGERAKRAIEKVGDGKS